MTVHTVLGPIDADELGWTSMHEHILSDLSCWSREPETPPPPGPIGPEHMGYLRWNALAMPDNLILADPDVAVDELSAVPAAGGSTIVELTLDGMGRRLAELPDISRRSGVQICVGAGYYVEETLPQAVIDADIDELCAMLRNDLDNGMNGTDIRPALLGEIGTSWPVTDTEWKVVRAAGRVGAETGAAVYMHLSFRGQGGVAVLEALIEEGMDPSRCIIGHLDEMWDKGYHREIAQAGAVLGYDTFGTDVYYGGPYKRCPTDFERFDMVSWLIEEGFANQLIIACDVWSQTNLRRNGGRGYEHLFARVAPGLAELAGGDDALVNTIMVDNPRRLLDRP